MHDIRILSLTLTHFLPILSGLGKDSITIDLSNQESTASLITVLIGKIGSCKTYILSHLQPFSTVGTLDIRNQDDPIIPEKDGVKEIVYLCDSHIYRIRHEYHWTGKTHSKKSFIEKDGVELNENGNRSSFEDIVEISLGITQSMLRLVRLGPNVINFINMKATERKAFIASLLQDTEIYITLHKAWSQDLRNANAQASHLMTKMSQFGTKSIPEWEEDLNSIQDGLDELKLEIDSLTKKKYEMEGENKSLMGGLSYSELKQRQAKLNVDIPTQREEYESMKDLISSFSKYPDITEVSREIGKMDQEIATLQESLHQKEIDHEEVSHSWLQLTEKRKLQADSSQMESLHESYRELQTLNLQYEEQLKGFTCKYSSAFLSSFLEDLNGINILIAEITQYDTSMIRKIFHSDSSVISFSKNKIEVLGYRKLALQKEINNLKFAEEYTPITPMYRPPFCPTDTCPYFASHPVQLQKKNKHKGEAEARLQAIQQEIQEIDVSIYQYSDYPLLYSKITALKKYWLKAVPVLSDIRALHCDKLENILTLRQYRVWYDYDRIVNTIDRLEKREKHFELTERIRSIQQEIRELEMLQSDTLEDELHVHEVRKKELEKDIESTENRIHEVQERLRDFNTMYLQLSEKTAYENTIREKKEQLKHMTDEFERICQHDEQIQQNLIRVQSLDQEIIQHQKDWNELSAQQDHLKTRIHDMKETGKELKNIVEEQKYLTYMVDAVSSKKGIPLVMIQTFLDSCQDIVNDLIHDVCEDDFEIVRFKLDSAEFRIPYIVNGQMIDDISKASQGQTSIVSTALSFALVQKASTMFYNIPLLDEMDAPLHKEYKQKYLAILLKHLQKIGSKQCFTITHDDNTFDGYPVQVIMTTEENINRDKYTNVIQAYA